MGGVKPVGYIRAVFQRKPTAFWIVVLVFIGLAAGCGGSDSSPRPFATFAEPDFENRTLTHIATLAEAQGLASFEIRLPSDSSYGFEFLGGTYSPPLFGGRGGEPLDDHVEMSFGNGQQHVYIMQAATRLQVGGSSEPIGVAGVTGKLVRGEKYDYPSTVYVSWTKDDRSYIASTTTNEAFTLDDLITFLGTIS